ncbi:hypothetical protein E2C01_096994 [Portunus trituberculatus]|uniref:Uncharacterized protein n=1 Tax=Portunus trituberculatus TaxID=210409 RepID=A0A5B7K4D1_PORTR|nr:hypothetical protein [Portunus trituberculatus]
MANGGRNHENGRDHYFHSASVDIHPCPESPCTDVIGATSYRSHVPYTKVSPDQGPSTLL